MGAMIQKAISDEECRALCWFALKDASKKEPISVIVWYLQPVSEKLQEFFYISPQQMI